MNKTEAKRIIYRHLFRELQPDTRGELMPSGLTEREQETFENACRDVMREMESKSASRRRRAPAAEGETK